MNSIQLTQFVDARPPSLVGTVIVAVVLVGLHWLEGLHVREQRTHDVVISLMLKFPLRYSATVWGAIWLFASIVLGIILPVWTNKEPEWIFSWPGLIFTINFSFLVPMLVLSYVALARGVNEFFLRPNLVSLGLISRVDGDTQFFAQSDRWRSTFRVVMFIMTMVIIWYGIAAISEPTSDGKRECCFQVPWVDEKDGRCELNWIGLSYYVFVRGINTYLALGLMFLALFLFGALFFRLDSRLDVTVAKAWFNKGNSLERFLVRLTACVVFGPAVVFFHGFAMFLESKSGIVSIAGRNVWLFFMVGSLFGTYLVISIIIWFISRIKEAEKVIRDLMLEEVESFVPDWRSSNNSYRERLKLLSEVDAYLMANRPTGPVNLSLTIGIVSAVLQILGIGIAAVQSFDQAQT